MVLAKSSVTQVVLALKSVNRRCSVCAPVHHQVPSPGACAQPPAAWTSEIPATSNQHISQPFGNRLRQRWASRSNEPGHLLSETNRNSYGAGACLRIEPARQPKRLGPALIHPAVQLFEPTSMRLSMCTCGGRPALALSEARTLDRWVSALASK